MKRKTLWKILVLVLSILIVGTVSCAFYLIDFALFPKVWTDREASVHYNDSVYTFMKPWTDSLYRAKALHDTVIVNRDGLKLNGYFIRSAHPTGNTAILIHGYCVFSYSMLPMAYICSHDLGYNVVLPDLQCHGRSEGHEISMGWKDRLDILQWSHVADSVFGGHTQMVVHGVSMGGATTMMLSGEKLPPYIKCFVDDCGYTSAWDEFDYELGKMFSLPAFPILYEADVICKLRYGWSFIEASALKQVAKCHLPMLFIHGDSDDFVPTRMVYPLYQAKPQPKELWIVKGAPHASSFRLNQHAYRERIARFVGKYIK